ncbi:MAG TPA: iron-sulfur cluster assembly accessory protein [Piscirickettsiaceae bacterium]|nr:iron-sulfur cluster assembly accessory protein [Piscirickettsiaceae bacterium]HIQ40766.1 iron-sulfur cluster assembly accessory protein [Sulfurivirga caldicuralii]
MGVQLTESAATRVKEMLAKRGRGIGMRVGVKKSGCAGYAYVVDYADEVGPEDEVFENHGVKVVVRRDDLQFIDGMTLDYVKEDLLNEGFQFHNPNVKDSCGCGESFSI